MSKRVMVVGAFAGGAVLTASMLPATAADPEPSGLSAPTIVGLGDSYMSGEGIILANHNYAGKDFKSGDSNWQTGQGAIGGNPETNQAVANTWGSVFGDANGYPLTGGKESILYCDRSYAAPSHIDGGWQTVNLACSGATEPTQVPPSAKFFKPGVDFYDGQEGQGQALMLENLAKTNDNIRVIALSIGGNDFGFGDIASACITDQSLWSECEKKQSTLDLVSAGAPKTRKAVADSITNIATAMKNAGYDSRDWKIVYQMPPKPIGDASQTKYNNTGGLFGNERASYGGCGLYNSTLDWIDSDVYPKLVDSMRKGLEDAREALDSTQLVVLETSKTFDGHMLCQKGTEGDVNYAKGQAGREPLWKNNNGKNTEWITYVTRLDQVSGNQYQKQYPLHPNYWGQRALADCMDRAKDRTGALQIVCTQDGDTLTEDTFRPKMKLSGAQYMWVLAVGRPFIDGDPNVGQTLTVDATGDFEPSDRTLGYSYQWLLDGSPIPGATQASYEVQGFDLGKDVSVKVTASLPGLDSDTAESRPVTITDIEVVTDPSISGPARVGATLAANPGTYNVVPDTIEYQWTEDGHDIPGATGSTYKATEDQLDMHIGARVTVTKAGYLPFIDYVEMDQPISEGILTVTGKPAITGTPKAGKVLTAQIAGIAFTPEATGYTYHWYRDGKQIPNADEQTYEPADGDQGKRISVSVTGHRFSYTDAETAVSPLTEPVAKGKIKVLKKPKLKAYDSQISTLKPLKKSKVGVAQEVAVDVTGVFSEWPNDPKVKWYRAKGKGAKKRIKGVDGLTFTPRAKDYKYKIWAKVTTTEDAFEPASATTAKVSVVKGEHNLKYPPVIRGKIKTGKTVKTTRAVFDPKAKVSYQWQRNGKNIKGADRRTYKITKKDKGKRLRVKATTKATKVLKKTVAYSPKSAKVK